MTSQYRPDFRRLHIEGREFVSIIATLCKHKLTSHWLNTRSIGSLTRKLSSEATDCKLTANV